MASVSRDVFINTMFEWWLSKKDFANYCRGAKDFILRWQEFQQKLKNDFYEDGKYYGLSAKQRTAIEKAVLSDVLSSNERFTTFSRIALKSLGK